MAFRLLFVAFLFLSSLVTAQIDKENSFYSDETKNSIRKNFRIDYKVDNDFETDDSGKLQKAIDELSSKGGGVLLIPNGNYAFGSVKLKSNVHLRIEENVVIRPFYKVPKSGKMKNYAIFYLGKMGEPIKNISITGIKNKKFLFDLTHSQNSNVAVVNCIKVSNFKISDFNVNDKHTIFSALTFGGGLYNDEYLFPKNGIVKNINVYNAHYGYGVVQTQSAENVLFKNLSGTGGATLRLETGLTSLNNLQTKTKRIGGVDKIVARNITSINGNCALMISPHAVHNGTVDAEGIVSVSSGFAIRIEGGFISKKYKKNIGLTKGTFQKIRIKNVNATFGELAEIKPKHFKYYPTELTPPKKLASYISKKDKKVFVGKSVAAILNDGNYRYKGSEKNVFIQEPIVTTGFEFQEPIID